MDPFRYTSGPRDANIVLIGEAWGREEREKELPFVGGAGGVLTDILSEAGIDRSSILLTNICDEQPPGNELSEFFEAGPPTIAGLRPGPKVLAGLEKLYSLLDAHPRKLVIAAGNYPLWALTNVTGSEPDGKDRPRKPSGIMKYRGSQLYRVRHRISDAGPSEYPVLPIVHPSAINRVWSNRQPTVHDLRTRVPLALRGQWTRPVPWRFDYMSTYERVLGQLSLWLHSRSPVRISLDMENARGVMTCIGLADSTDYALCVPFVRMDTKGNFSSYWSSREEITIKKLLCSLFRAPHVLWIGQNFIYDSQWIWWDFGVVPKMWWDTFLAQNLLLPGTDKDLGYLSSIYCEWHRYWKDDNREWSKGGSLEQHLRYNCEDCCRTWEIAHQQMPLINPGQWSHERFKFRLGLTMFQNGFLVDQKQRALQGVRLTEAAIQLTDILSKVVPPNKVERGKSSKPWWSSPKQAMWLFYSLWRLRVQLDKKTKRPSTGKIALMALKTLYPRLGLIFTTLEDLRSVLVIYRTFISSRLEYDGRFRSQFNSGPNTFRWNSRKNAQGRGGNMQNVPVGGEDVDESKYEIDEEVDST